MFPTVICSDEADLNDLETGLGRSILNENSRENIQAASESEAVKRGTFMFQIDTSFAWI